MQKSASYVVIKWRTYPGGLGLGLELGLGLGLGVGLEIGVGGDLGLGKINWAEVCFGDKNTVQTIAITTIRDTIAIVIIAREYLSLSQK